MTNSVWIHEMFWPDIATYLETGDTVMVPIGATEQHGPHTALTVSYTHLTLPTNREV